MRRPVLLRTVCAAAISVGCGEQPVAPPTTGSISLGIVAAEATPEPPAAAGQLDAARVRVKCSSASCGSTDVMANLARTGTNFTGTVNGLPPGAYAVVVEGLVANEVDYFGQTSGVQVTAGSNATAAITNWASFRPVLADLNSPTAETRFTAIWSRVANANGYSVEWGKTPSFTSRSPASVPDTFATITVNDTGIYNVRVRAVNDWEPSGGVGDAKSITVAATTTLQNGAPASGLTGAGGSQRYFKIQVTAEPPRQAPPPPPIATPSRGADDLFAGSARTATAPLGSLPPPSRGAAPAKVETSLGKLGAGDGRSVPVVGRNEPCPCGSGKKYKKCHGAVA